jgi:hypothetical protein
LLDNTEYEVKAVLQIIIMAVKKEKICNVNSVIEEELDVDTLQKQPGMVGCIRGCGEDLWDIAKRYHATSENIIEIGNRVLVVKQVK